MASLAGVSEKAESTRARDGQPAYRQIGPGTSVTVGVREGREQALQLPMILTTRPCAAVAPALPLAESLSPFPRPPSEVCLGTWSHRYGR